MKVWTTDLVHLVVCRSVHFDSAMAGVPSLGPPNKIIQSNSGVESRPAMDSG